jgi:AAA domain
MSAADAWVEADPTLCPTCGTDSCEEHLPGATARPVRVDVAQPLIAQPARSIMCAPPPIEIVEGIAAAGRLTALISESGSGKTFLKVDLSGAVSDGVSWHGRETQQGSVVYLLFEGDAIGLRCRAARDVAGRRMEHVYFIQASDPLSPLVTREGERPSHGEIAAATAIDTLSRELQETGRPPIVLFIIDTVRASLAGNEDSSEHTAAYLRAVRRLTNGTPSAATIMSHHAGWQDGESPKKRERGSSAWRGNVDTTLYLEAGAYDAERGEAPLTLRTLKIRDQERPAPLHLIRRRVELLEMGRHGEPVTSCIIERDRRTREDRDAEKSAAMADEQRVTDLQVLRFIVERPEMATSQDGLRLLTGTRKETVSDSLSRLVRAGWALPGPRKKPYTATPAGLAALHESTP